MIFSRGHIVKELRADAVTENNITTAILTATTQRERGSESIGRIWKWAAGDRPPILILAITVFVLGLYASHVNEFYLSNSKSERGSGSSRNLAIVAYGQQALMLVGGIDLSVGPLMGLVVVIL